MTPEQASAWSILAVPLSERLGLQPPPYPVGIEVTGRWEDEYGQSRQYAGFIVGIFPAPLGWLDGWWYLVRLTNFDGQETERRTYDDECHEAELLPAGEVA